MQWSLMRFILLTLLFPILCFATLTDQERQKTLEVLESKHFAMDLVAGFHSEGIDGPMYGQAKTAATIRFLWNRGVPTTVNLEPRTNGLQALIVIREFYENGEDLYLLPDMFNLTGTSKQRFAFLPVFGSVNDIAFSVALTNNSPIAHEEINVKKYIDESEIYDDGGRFNTKFLNMGLGLKTKILKSLKSGCNFLFASKR